MPDGSLSLYGFDIPFIVCEVAVSQTLKSVMEKMRPYLLGSKNKIRFLIIIDLKTRPPTPISTETSEVEPSATSLYKAGHVFVYTTTIRPSAKDPTRRVRSIKTVVENLVCPSPSSIYQAVANPTRNSGLRSQPDHSH